MRALIISDKIPGHLNQSIGLVKILSESIDIDYDILDSKYRIPLFRSLFIQFHKLLSNNLNIKKSTLILKAFRDFNIDKFDLIITTGKKVSYHSAALSFKFGIKNIHVGTLKNIDPKYFDIHITSYEDNFSPNNIFTIIPPTRITPLKQIQNNNKILFLIGGDGAGYFFRRNDWDNLIKNIRNLKRINNISPIIVTSRRLKKYDEKYIFDNICDLCDKNSVWFHRDERTLNLEKLFQKVRCVFVSEESTTMTAESISSGLPVVTFYPKKFNPDKTFIDQIHRYEKMKLIKRQNINNNQLDISLNKDNYINIMYIREQLKNQIIKKLSL
tara:strand:- start:1313 stop:2296 length:984 start_codon:yes stop_codon:yes gene_type:complete